MSISRRRQAAEDHRVAPELEVPVEWIRLCRAVASIPEDDLNHTVARLTRRGNELTIAKVLKLHGKHVR